ncbi:MAG: DegT/DnrJ/EryC1/StrS family aminotransferase [Fluviicola sp.]|nr:DegT/DnrJ/EryC1/StrS family aminotransferase [Fluviicola sp.]
MKRINVTETYLPPKEEYFELISKLWETRWLTNRGEYTLKLEHDLKQYLGSSALPLLVNNGTIALQIAIKSLGLKGEIITTPFTYIATSSSIIWEHCTPVFVDIDSDSFNIDPRLIQDKITDKTSAIMAVHVFGNPCKVEEINKIAKKNNLKVIYDAAHCFGVKYRGKSIFDYGHISTCSFHATKLFHTGEGGAIFCNEAINSDTIFYHHNFGHDGQERFFGLGINAKMNELNAAMGVSLLPYMEGAIGKRKHISESYDELLDFSKLEKQKIRENTDYNYSYYPITFESEDTLLRTKEALNENNIFPRRYFYPSLNTIGYLKGEKMTNSESVAKRILCLPLFPQLEDEQITRIITIINSQTSDK